MSHTSQPTGSLTSFEDCVLSGGAPTPAGTSMFIAGILLFYCMSKHPNITRPQSLSHQEQKTVSSSNPLQPIGPVYEEVMELRQNTAYEPTQTQGIDTKAYTSMQH